MDKERYRKILPMLNKRPRVVLEHILEHGSVSTYELGQLGYDQPPRAAMDLKDAGIKCAVKYGKHPETGHRMAIYYLADDDSPLEVRGGRTAFPKQFRLDLFSAYGNRCNICNKVYSTSMLQCDHRTPFILDGEVERLEFDKFQPLCAPHQRAKSWECEHCPNRVTANERVCATCFWAIPDGYYTHVATRDERVADITFSGEDDRQLYDHYVELARRRNCSVEEIIKEELRRRT